MIYYVTHKYDGSAHDIEQAIEVCAELQHDDMNNCYVCPIFAFSHLSPEEISEDDLTELRLDLLSVCDVLIVATKPDRIMRQEIAFAERIGMEIDRLEY